MVLNLHENTEVAEDDISAPEVGGVETKFLQEVRVAKNPEQAADVFQKILEKEYPNYTLELKKSNLEHGFDWANQLPQSTSEQLFRRTVEAMIYIEDYDRHPERKYTENQQDNYSAYNKYLQVATGPEDSPVHKKCLKILQSVRDAYDSGANLMLLNHMLSTMDVSDINPQLPTIADKEKTFLGFNRPAQTR